MTDFQQFCGLVCDWLIAAPVLDPGLAAAADLLLRRELRAGQWFECEIRHIAAQADDLHAVLGARALLELWRTVTVKHA